MHVYQTHNIKSIKLCIIIMYMNKDILLKTKLSILINNFIAIYLHARYCLDSNFLRACFKLRALLGKLSPSNTFCLVFTHVQQSSETGVMMSIYQ